MGLIVTIVFGILSAVLLWRLLVLRRMLGELSTAVERRRVYILGKRRHFPFQGAFQRLAGATNALVSDSALASREQQDFIRRIEMTLGALREGVLLVDSGNTIWMANDGARRLIGFEGSAIGRRLESLMTSSRFLAYVKAVQQGELGRHEEVEIRRESSSRWLEVIGTRLPEQEPNHGTLTLLVLHDISERKRLESMRTEFVANISHELRTPVTVIKGFCDTLLEDHEILPPDERTRFLLKIQRNVERLDALLADLLTLSRLENSTETLALERIDLGDLVAEVCENFRDRLGPGQTVVVDHETDKRYPVRVDPVRISQALENLMENALRHARGMRQLCVQVRGDHRLVTCTVVDDGCGIPRHDLDRIFERFYRVEKGRSRERGGTGLGLSIVKHIVQQHRGTVRAESEMGRGSRFQIELPIETEIP